MKTKYITAFAIAAVLSSASVASAEVGAAIKTDVNVNMRPPQGQMHAEVNEGMHGNMATGTMRQTGSNPMMKPLIFGIVTAVSGNTITISVPPHGTTTSSTTLTIDASAAAVDKNHTLSSISDIAVGDRIVAEGSINGSSSVTATKIHDGAVVKANMDNHMQGNYGNNNNQGNNGLHLGFFARIGAWFRGLFGGSR